MTTIKKTNPDNLNKFPTQSFCGNSIKIQYLTLNDFHYAIRQAFNESSISIKKFEWNKELCQYEIEYGTMPLEFQFLDSAYDIIYMRFIVECCAKKALILFPHLQNDVDLGKRDPRDKIIKYCRFEIQLFWNYTDDCMEAVFLRSYGESESLGLIWNIINKYFKHIQNQQNQLKNALLESNIVSYDYLREYLVTDLI